MEDQQLLKFLDSIISNRHKLMLLRERDKIISELCQQHGVDEFDYEEEDNIDSIGRAEEANRNFARDMDSMYTPNNNWYD